MGEGKKKILKNLQYVFEYFEVFIQIVVGQIAAEKGYLY